MDAKSDVGRLVLLGAPVRKSADDSARLREVLATADLVAAEDTRRLARELEGDRFRANGLIF